jgi:hypothetical protein
MHGFARSATPGDVPALRICVDDNDARGDHSFRYNDYLKDRDSFAPLFRAERLAGRRLRCGCGAPDGPEVGYRLLGNGRIILVRLPGTTADHADWCPLAVCAGHPSVSREARIAAIEEQSDGTFYVSLVDLLDPRAASDGSGEHRTKTRRGNARVTAQLLGLAEYLIWKKGLNKYNPNYVMNWAEFSKGLAAQAACGTVCLGGGPCRPLNEMMYVIPKYTSSKQGEINAAQSLFLSSFGQGQRFILCGEFRKLQSAGEDGFHLYFRHLNTPVSISKDVQERAERSFRIAHRAGRRHFDSKAYRALVIAVCEADPSGIKVCSIAWQLTSRNYILCDSQYEVRLADKIAAEARFAYKPLRRDLSYGVLPDFVLTDTLEPWPLEVLGIDDPNYDAHFGVKQTRYTEHWKAPWQWIAYRDSVIPDLPPRAHD